MKACVRTMVGLSDFIAVVSRPLTSLAPEGAAISIPGRFQYMPNGLSECCAPPPCRRPWLMWRVTGQPIVPPDEVRAVEISFAIEEIAGYVKEASPRWANIRCPTIAAPAARAV